MQYMGSKSRIAKHIVPIIQAYIDDNAITQYIEPFVGGANVIDKIKCERKYGFDSNPYLIALLQRVRNGGSLYDEVPRELYNEARSAYHAQDNAQFSNWEFGNIGFLASYNGRWFDGGYAKAGYVKTKNGLVFRDYYQEAKRNLMSQAQALKGIQFQCCDYRNISNYCKHHNSVIYCDPPYQGTKKYANSQWFDYEDFWDIMRVWSQDNIVLISEQNAPDDFECIWEQEVGRIINATNKGKAIEKLFKLKQ